MLDQLAKRYQKPNIEPDPVVWAKKTFGTDLYSKQRVIMRLLEIVPKVAVPSCHDAGKSFTAALAAARFLAKYPPGTARVVSTAPTMTQVRAILWNEINALHALAIGPNGTSLLPGRVNQTEWWIGGYMAGIGRKPSDYAPETFSGLHAEHILIIVDEAGDVPNEIWTGVDTLATNTGAVILAIGNPNDPQAEFKTIVEGAPDNGWTVVQIPAWETPNLSGELVTPKLRNVLLSREWVEDKRIKWGEDSPLWAAKVAAEFPSESGMTIIRLSDLNASLTGDVTPPAPRTRGRIGFEDVQLGVDIAASETGDKTVIRERRGHKILRRWSIQTEAPEEIAELIVRAGQESDATMIHVDATGVGFGFLSEIRKRLPDVAVIPFIAAAQADDRAQFENRRAEAHWYTREKMRRRELDLSQMEEDDAPDKGQLTTSAQLLSIRYKIKKGKILVEKKDEIRKRIGSSPDDSDAFLLAILPGKGAGAPAPATARASSSRRRAAHAIETVRETLPDHGSGPRAVPQREVAAPSRIGVRPRGGSLRARPS